MPAQLSGGQQQRVALARALSYDPPVLLMDEPLSALDKKLRDEIQIEIRRIHRETGVTILYVTHDQEEALRLSDRIAVFNKGRIDQVGSGTDLYQKPATRFVAGFVGDSNFLKVSKVVRENGSQAKVTLPDGTEFAGIRLHADASSDSPRELMVRPQSIRLAGPQDKTTLDVKVLDITFLGENSSALLETRWGQRIWLKAPAREVSHAQIDTTVPITWDMDTCEVY